MPVEECIASMENSVRTAALGGAELLQFCEDAFTVTLADKEIMLSKTAQAAKDNQIDVLMALEIENEEGLNENSTLKGCYFCVSTSMRRDDLSRRL